MTSSSAIEKTHSRRAFNLESALTVIRRRAWVMALFIILTPVAAFGLSKAQTKQYTATASILFTNQSVAQQASGVTPVGQSDPQGQRNTNLTLVQLGAGVAQPVAAELHAGLTAQQVKSAITASLEGQSNVVSISATWTSPELAAKLANAYATEFTNLQNQQALLSITKATAYVTKQFQGLPAGLRRSSQGQSLQDHAETLTILGKLQNSVQPAQSATVPTAPSAPQVARNTLLGFVLGVLLGVGFAFLLERFDRSLREPQDVEESFGLPLLGLIPRSATASKVGGTPMELEPFRMLRAHLRYFNVDRELRILIVTSAKPAEGKTTIATNLAATAATMGTRTLLIEADLRKPVMASRLSLKPSVGVAGALVSVGSLQDAVQHVDPADGGSNGSATGRLLDVLPAGAVPPNPTELLESHAMEHLLTWAREHYELVVIDTAPLSVVADTIPLMKHADGVIVVSRLGTSTRDSAEHLSDRLVSLGAPVLGVVVNDVRSRSDSYYGYGYGEYISEEPKSRGRGNGEASEADLSAVANGEAPEPSARGTQRP